MDQKQF
ncbi:hypothetical protein GWI33_003960, partial [Rhynchophorus ferrugineus]